MGLRGRYLLAIGLGALLGGAGAVVSWRLGYPVYESMGLIRIANARPQVLNATDQNEPLPGVMFDTFMQSQKLLISSRRVVEVAVQDPIWKAMDRSVPQPSDKFFASSMKVDVRSRSEIIEVAVDDRDPQIACAAVTSVMNAFNDYYTNEEKRTERQHGVLVDRRDAITSEIDKLGAVVGSESEEFGGSDPDMFCNTATQKVARLESALSDIRAAIASRAQDQAGTAATNSNAALGPETPALSPQMIAMSDPSMRMMLDEQLRSQQELRRMLSELGSAHRK